MKIAKQNEYQMLLNDKDEVIFPPIASLIVDIGENMFAVRVVDKFGVIDSKGKTILPFKFDDYSKFSHGLVVMERNQTFFVFNAAGWLIYRDPYVDRLGGFDGEYLYATNYDEDEFTHERQTAFAKIRIESINKPMDNYEYNKRFLKEKTENENMTEKDRKGVNYYQPSFFDLQN